MKTRLGLYATPFGFGPVSKAIAIAKSVNRYRDVEWFLIGQGISLEFMKREGIHAHFIDTSVHDTRAELIDQIGKRLDAAVVLMDNQFADDLAAQIPVFFADSLGYMWRKEDFESLPNFKKIKRYYVQNVFGDYGHLIQVGLENLKSVSPIIDINCPEHSEYEGRTVIHLGGLFNPLNRATTEIYLLGICEIVSRMKIKDPLFLMSEIARRTFPSLLKDFETQSLPHKKAIAAIKRAEFVWSSPGLTTILEMAHLGVKMAPLPPQNYSQVLNIRNMAQKYGNILPEMWHFLNREYSEIKFGMPEDEGVRQITELNSEKMMSDRFRIEFLSRTKDELTYNTSLPKELISSSNGADEVAQDICQYFETSQCLTSPRN